MESANQKKLNKNIFFGNNDIAEVMSRVYIVTTPGTIFLPITTRGIGFIVRQLTSKFAHIPLIDHHQFCCALYRVSLLMLEIKIMKAAEMSASPQSDISVDFIRIIGNLDAFFGPLLHLISCVGAFRRFGAQFVPRFVLDGIRDQHPVWEPTLITFSNLRKYAEVLSNETTHVADRNHFYQHSPLPQAIWRKRDPHEGGEAMNALLLNPNDVMPADYGNHELRADVSRIMDAIEVIGRKYDRYVYAGRIDFNASGEATQLVSSEGGNIRCTDLASDPQISYSLTRTTLGTIDCFWSSEAISDAEFNLGTFHLIGETPNVTDKVAFVKRSRSIATMDCDGSHYANSVAKIFC